MVRLHNAFSLQRARKMVINGGKKRPKEERIVSKLPINGRTPPARYKTRTGRGRRRGRGFNYSLLPTRQFGDVTRPWGVHKSVVISIRYPEDISGRVQKLHTVAGASRQLISCEWRGPRGSAR